MSNNPVVRIAPSPTGNLHIGTARTALFNFLFARQTGGKFIVRIEDTDKERSKKEYEENILESLEWLGLKHDEFARQSERTGIYKEYLEKIISDGKAYISEEPAKDDPARQVAVVRLKNPGKSVTFSDMIRGDVTFDTTELGDFVIAKSIEEPLYHFAVVVDDHEMKVTHVLRGEDHISNTPRQILIQEAIGAERPAYAHIPLILAKDRSKMSKRHGATAVTEYRDRGYLSDAVVNYLALLGWNPGTDKEIFTLEELAEEFDITRIQKGGAIFDEEKLRWVNKEHMKRGEARILVCEAITSKIQKKFNIGDIDPRITELIFERIETLSNIDELIESGELDYFFSRPTIEKDKLFWKNSNASEARENLEKVLQILDSEDNFDKIKGEIMSLAERAGKGNVLWPLRFSLSGREKSPDPFTILGVLGIAESRERIKHAAELL